MKIDNSVIEFSRADISQNVKLPLELTPSLAEIVGVILGDGHIAFGKKYKNSVSYTLFISGSASEDTDYYKDSFNPMFFNLFNKPLRISFNRNNELIVRLYSKSITKFFVNLGIGSGRKVDNNYIPEIILNSDNEIKSSFLRGVFDTDGSISFKKDYWEKHSHPIIKVAMKSDRFISQLKNLLENLNFKVIFYKEDYFDKRFFKNSVRYTIELAGKKNLKNFLSLIDFRNPRHLTKVAIWKKFGFCPPKTTLEQRKNILNGSLNISEVYRY